MYPHDVLSITVLDGRDFIFRDLPLSIQLGLKQGDPVPSELAQAQIFFWVESAVLETPLPSGFEVKALRESLGHNQKSFDRYVGLPSDTTAEWEG